MSENIYQKINSIFHAQFFQKIPFHNREMNTKIRCCAVLIKHKKFLVSFLFLISVFRNFLFSHSLKICLFGKHFTLIPSPFRSV